jgi:hypothetical protein
MTANESSSPEKVSGLIGVVIADEYAKGSKSHHQAFFLQTDQDRFMLRRKTGPAIGDKELLKYLGKQVRCDGFLVANLFLAELIKQEP